MLSKDWEFARLGKDNLRDFGSKLNDDETEIIIANCKVSWDNLKFLESPNNLDTISFRNVVFTDYCEFRVFPSIDRINIQQSIFRKRSIFNLENCFFDIAHTIFEEHCTVVFDKGLLAIGCKFSSLKLMQLQPSYVDITGSWCNELSVSRHMVSIHPENMIVEKTSRFHFNGFISKEILFNPNILFSSILLQINHTEDDDSYGDVKIYGGEGLRNLEIKTIGISHKDFKCKSLLFDYSVCRSKNITIDSLNINLLKFTGKNSDSFTEVKNCSVVKFEINDYLQIDTASLVLNNVNGFKTEDSELLVKDSIFANNNFYFQNCNLKNWKMSFPGSKFLYQSLSSILPEYTSETLGVDEKLNAYNTILNNTRKEDDVINWSELKKQQWLVLWEKRKGNITAAQCVQKVTQWTNDFGTKWQRAFWLYLGFNFVVSVLVTFFNCDLIHCYMFPCQSTAILWGEFQEVFSTYLYPLSKPKDINLIFVSVKVINAVLLVQLVAAFRGYFKGR